MTKILTYSKVQFQQFYRPMLLNLAMVMFIFTLIRCVFFISNKNVFPTLDFFQGIKYIVVGWRFDLSSVLYINALYILTVILPFPWRTKQGFQSFQKYLFLVTNFIFLCFEIGEISFFAVTLRRMLFSDFNLIFNTLDQWKVIIPKNIHLLLGGIFIFYFFKKIYEKIQKNIKSKDSDSQTIEKPHWSLQVLTKFLFLILCVGLFILGGRGGLQLRPITPISAADYVKDSRWTPLLSNTTMSFFCSFQQNFIQKKNYFDEKTLETYTQKWIYQPDNQAFTPLNVVVIAMESFGCDYTSEWNDTKGFTPFLDSLLHEGAYCKNSFANALRSAQGIVAITAGIPQLMDDALQFSPYQNNQINSFASLLKPKGYYSAFFHGSKPGSMMFDKYAGLAMYDHFEDKTDYPNPADDDGNWGIYDVPYFQYVVKKMNEMPEPFHTFTFSLTSHYPYVAEPWFEKKYPDMEAYQRCVLYSDYALRKFFESASKQKWFENTIFVISADHTGPFPRPQYQTRLGRFRIPILFYSPNPIVQERLSQKLENTTLQQVDILPSVMGLLHYDQNFKTFGKNIFDKKNNNTLTVNYIDGIYQVVSPDFNLLFDGQKTLGMYEYQKDIYLTNDLSEKFPAEKKRLEDYGKAIIQAHHNAMIDNKVK